MSEPVRDVPESAFLVKISGGSITLVTDPAALGEMVREASLLDVRSACLDIVQDINNSLIADGVVARLQPPKPVNPVAQALADRKAEQ